MSEVMGGWNLSEPIPVDHKSDTLRQLFTLKFIHYGQFRIPISASSADSEKKSEYTEITQEGFWLQCSVETTVTQCNFSTGKITEIGLVQQCKT